MIKKLFNKTNINYKMAIIKSEKQLLALAKNNVVWVDTDLIFECNINLPHISILANNIIGKTIFAKKVIAKHQLKAMLIKAESVSGNPVSVDALQIAN